MDNLLEDVWYKADRERWAVRRGEIREAFVELLGEGEPEPPAELDLQWHEERREEGLWLRKLSIVAEEDDRISAWLVMPEDLATPAPAILCMHGTTADAKEACLGIGTHPGGS